MKTMEQLKSQMNPNMTLDEFFLSEVMRNFTKELIDEIVGKEDLIELELLYDKDTNYTASASVFRIRVNLASVELQHFDTFEERFKEYIGIVSHELGHIIFSRITNIDSFRGSIDGGELWPVPFEKMEMHSKFGEETLKIMSEDVKKYKANRKLSGKLFTDIFNIFEDKYVERRMSEYFPDTLKPCIDFMRSSWLELNLAQKRSVNTLQDTLIGLFSFIFDLPALDTVDSRCLNAAHAEFLHYGLTDDDFQRSKLYSAVTVCIYPIIKDIIEQHYESKKQKEQNGEKHIGENN